MKNSTTSTIKKHLSSLTLYSVLILVLVYIAGCTPPPIPKAKGKSEAQLKKEAELRNKPQMCVITSSRRQNITDVIHGTTVRDPYRWLENGKSEETKLWLSEETTCTKKFLAKLPGRNKINKRLKELYYFNVTSAPSRKGNRYFYSRREAKQEKAVYYWKEGTDGEEKILLDPNKLSTNGSISVKGINISHNGKYAAYRLSINNADSATMHIKEVETGKDLKDIIPGCKYASANWDSANKGFYYTRLPTDKKIPESELPGYAEVYYHRLGKDYKKDKLIYKKTGDPRKFIAPQTTYDGRYLIIYIQFGWTNVDVYFKDLRNGGKFKVLAKDTNSMYDISYYKGYFYILTNNGAPKYQLFRTRTRSTSRKRWKVIVPESKDSVLRNISIIGGKLALSYLHKASSKLEVRKLNGEKIRDVVLPGIGSSWGLTGHPKYDEAYYSFSSFIFPKTIYKTSMKNGGSTQYAKVSIPFDSSKYIVEQVEYLSKDGTKITMFIIRNRNFIKNGKNPFILYGYGGFNISLTPRFISARIVWLENGGSLAIPNLRGGGEYGEAWHHAGMLNNKQNVFDDFIYAAKYLINNKYSSPSKLAIRGGSNGGLLVGAAMVQAPKLFKVVSCHVPLLDMVRYHLFGAGKTWISEYGSSDNAQQFQSIFAYSPYHHVQDQTDYPALLMMTADSDDRVDPMHARKFVAAVQHAIKNKKTPILLRMESHSGHGGGDKVSKRVKSYTDEYLFLMSQLGMLGEASPVKSISSEKKDK